MRTKKWLLFMTALTVLSVLFASCSPVAAPTPTPKVAPSPPKAESPSAKASPAPTAPSPSPQPSGEQPRYGGTLKIGDIYEPGDYDIHQGAAIGIQAPLANIYNGLLQFDPVGDPTNIISDLAERWEVTPDGKTYAFYLRKEVKWHDGKGFSSEDVKFSLERLANPPRGTASPRQSWFEGVGTIETPDAHTVKIMLRNARAVFIPFIAAGWTKMLAKHVVEAFGSAKSAKAVVGTGPFKFKEHASGVVFETARNSDYFIKGRPYVDGIQRYYIKDDATRFAAFRTHRVDMLMLFAYALSSTRADIVEKELAGKATVHRWPGLVVGGIGMNTKMAPFTDVRVRKAAALSIDRSKLKEVMIEEPRAGGLFLPGGKWALTDDELAKMPGYGPNKEADRAEARKLLAEAGYSDGFKVKLLNRISGVAGEVREQFFQDQLKTVGIQLELGAVDDARYTGDLLTDKRFSIAALSEGLAVDDPDAWFMPVFYTKGTRNYTQFSDKEVDDILEKQSQTLDEKERRDLVVQAQKKVMELAPVVATHWYWGRTGSWNEVRNWRPGNGLYERTMFQDVWLAK